jgi:uncharacterized delta-60 repeat protein
MLARSGRVALVACALWGLVAVSSASAAPGDLDLTFNGDGLLTTDMPRRFDVVEDVAIQANGKIVVAGWSYKIRAATTWTCRNCPPAAFALARYNPDGSLDRSFGGDGKVLTGFPGAQAAAFAVATQPDGKIVAAGRAGGSFALVRYRWNGTLDQTFHDDGKVRTDLTPPGEGDPNRLVDIVFDLVIRPNGKIVAGGQQDLFKFGSNLALVSYRPNGTIDRSFGGGDGQSVHKFSQYSGSRASDLALQTDGKIVAGGCACARAGGLGLVRFNVGGTLDDTFGTGGGVMTGLPGSEIHGVTIDTDGNIVAVGAAGPGAADGVLARFLPNGTLDPAFGTDGIVTTANQLQDVGIQSDGKVVAVGSPIIVVGGPIDVVGGSFELARYKIDGTLDDTFGRAGNVTTDFPIGDNSTASSLVIQPDDKIVAAGRVGFGAVSSNPATPSSRFAVARYPAE